MITIIDFVIILSRIKTNYHRRYVLITQHVLVWHRTRDGFFLPLILSSLILSQWKRQQASSSSSFLSITQIIFDVSAFDKLLMKAMSRQGT